MKKWISLLLAATLCVIIPGCTNQASPITSTSSDDTKSSGGPSNDSSQTTPSTPTSSDDMTSSSSSSNDSSQTSSLSSDISEISEDDKRRIEKLGVLMYKYVKDHRNTDAYVSYGLFGDDKHYLNIDPPNNNPRLRVTIPVPSHNYIFQHPSAYDVQSWLYEPTPYVALIFAYLSEKDTNTISFVSTIDGGQSWQTSELNNVENANERSWKLALRNDEEGGLLVCGYNGGDHIFYTTEDTGKTWEQASSIPGSAITGVCNMQTQGLSYWITGHKSHYPAILKSDDGVNWQETQISIDTKKYKSGFVNRVYIDFDDVGMGLAEVAGETSDGDTVPMLYYSEDHGETWSFYKIGRIT